MALLDGDTVAAIAPMQPGAPPGVPPIWNTYLAVDDVDAAAEKAAPAGGQLLMPPADVGDAGRMAFVADPTGAVVGLWQANRHIGATLVGDTGAVVWTELSTDKPQSALAFYETVVGLAHAAVAMAPGLNYILFKVGGNEVGGWEPQVPAHRTTGMCTSPSTMSTPQRRRRFDGRTRHHGADRHPHRWTVRGAERPAGCGLQRAETRTSAIGRLPVTGADTFGPAIAAAWNPRPCTVGSTS